MREKLEKSLKEAFEKHVAYDGFSVNFSDVDENCFNANIEGTYQFALIGCSPVDALIKLGGSVGEDFELEDEQNTVKIYARDPDSACLAFDASGTLFLSEDDEDDAQDLGESLAKSINAAVAKIINESKKSIDNSILPGKPLK